MKTFDKIAYSGVWTQPLIMSLLVRTVKYTDPRERISLLRYVLLFLASCAPMLCIWIKNRIAYRNGKRRFGLFDAFGSAINH